MVILGGLAQPSGLAGHLCRTWQACIAGFARSHLQALDISMIQKCKKGDAGPELQDPVLHLRTALPQSLSSTAEQETLRTDDGTQVCPLLAIEALVIPPAIMAWHAWERVSYQMGRPQ